MNIENFINYRTFPNGKNANALVRRDKVGLKTMSVMMPNKENFLENLTEHNRRMFSDAKKELYNIDENFTNIPFYMLKENELAYIVDMNRYAFLFNEEDKKDFAFMTELIFSDAELEYEFLLNTYSKGLNKDFIFSASCYLSIQRYAELTKRVEKGLKISKEDEQFLEECKHDYDNGYNDYDGRFPRYNELISKIYRSKYRDDFKDVRTMSDTEYSELMFFLNLLVTVNLWEKWKKVYSLSKDLYDDFMRNFRENKEVDIPLQVLNNIPFSVFYLNLRNYNVKNGKGDRLDGAYVKLLRSEDGEILGVSICTTLIGSNSYSYSTGSILVNIKDYTKDGVFTLSRDYFVSVLDNALWKYSSSTEVIKKAIAKVMYLVMETVFYLCCTNKKQNKNHYVNMNSVSRNKSEEIEDVTIGFVFSNELRRQIEESKEEDGDELLVNNTGKRRHRPHLVSGHFHHYWTKKGLILKYVEPYFTGQNCSFITNTVCK